MGGFFRSKKFRIILSGTLLLTGRMVAAGRIYMPGRIRLYEYPDGNSKNKSIGQHDHF